MCPCQHYKKEKYKNCAVSIARKNQEDTNLLEVAQPVQSPLPLLTDSAVLAVFVFLIFVSQLAKSQGHWSSKLLYRTRLRGAGQLGQQRTFTAGLNILSNLDLFSTVCFGFYYHFVCSFKRLIFHPDCIIAVSYLLFVNRPQVVATANHISSLRYCNFTMSYDRIKDY